MSPPLAAKKGFKKSAGSIEIFLRYGFLLLWNDNCIWVLSLLGGPMNPFFWCHLWAGPKCRGKKIESKKPLKWIIAFMPLLTHSLLEYSWVSARNERREWMAWTNGGFKDNLRSYSPCSEPPGTFAALMAAERNGKRGKNTYKSLNPFRLSILKAKQNKCLTYRLQSNNTCDLFLGIMEPDVEGKRDTKEILTLLQPAPAVSDRRWETAEAFRSRLKFRYTPAVSDWREREASVSEPCAATGSIAHFARCIGSLKKGKKMKFLSRRKTHDGTVQNPRSSVEGT